MLMSISIHALLAESDRWNSTERPVESHFYPRSPCGERLLGRVAVGSRMSFLSTLSLRRATGIIDIINNIIDHFYPRSPCGERHTNLRRHRSNDNFYPRSPCGERRNAHPETRRHDAISIHALLAESDNTNLRRHRSDNNFYPRSPCGERLCLSFRLVAGFLFLSTLSLRRATAAVCQIVSSKLYFYPRSPCGERQNNNYCR